MARKRTTKLPKTMLIKSEYSNLRYVYDFQCLNFLIVNETCEICLALSQRPCFLGQSSGNHSFTLVAFPTFAYKLSIDFTSSCNIGLSVIASTINEFIASYGNIFLPPYGIFSQRTMPSSLLGRKGTPEKRTVVNLTSCGTVTLIHAKFLAQKGYC